MLKKVLGTIIIAILIGIVVINLFEQNNDEADSEANEYDVTGDTNVDGEYIVSEDNVGIQPGNKAPDFELETLDGEKIKLSDLQGKKVILNFWATWCPPCKKEMPEMQEYYDDYKDEVEILAVNAMNTETNKQAVPEYIDENSYTYTIPLDKDGDVSQKYEVLTFPTSYFIGTDGMVQESRIGPMTYEFMEETVNNIN